MALPATIVGLARSTPVCLFVLLALATFVSATFSTTYDANDASDENDEDPPFPEMDEVTAFLQKFGTLTGSVADVGAYMNKLSHQTHAMFKVGFPVGALIAGSMRIASKTESRKYLALRQLNGKMEELFKKVEELMRFGLATISLEDKVEDYINKVNLPSAALHFQMKLFSTPSINKTDALVSKFRNLCYYSDVPGVTPIGILDYIYEHTVKSCNEVTSTKMIKLLSHLYAVFSQIKQKIDGPYSQELFDAKSQKYGILFVSLEPKMAEQLLAEIVQHANAMKAYSSSALPLKKIETIFSAYVDDVAEMQSCLLRTIIVGTRFNWKAVEELENVIRLDLLQQVVFGTLCANLTFSGDEDTMQFYEQTIVRRVHEIITHMRKYVSSELSKSFPYIEMGAVKESIDSMRLAQPPSLRMILNASITVFEKLSTIGNKRYARQGFVVDSIKLDADFTFVCPYDSCFTILDYNGLHVFVTRYEEETDYTRAINSNDWFGSWRVGPFVWNRINENYNIARVKDLKEKIETAFGANLTSGHSYRSLALLRNAYNTPACMVKAQSRLSDIAKLPAYATVSYYYEGSLIRDSTFFFSSYCSKMMDTDFDKQSQQREAESLRSFAFFGVCLSTVATVICVLYVPFAYQHFQQLDTLMQNELDFCKLRSNNMWREVTRTQTFSKVAHESRHKRQAGGCCGCGQSPPGPPGPPGPSGQPGGDGQPGGAGQPGAHEHPVAVGVCRNVRQDIQGTRDLLGRPVSLDSPETLELRPLVEEEDRQARLDPPDPVDSPVELDNPESREHPDISRRGLRSKGHLGLLARPDIPEDPESRDTLETPATPEAKDHLEMPVARDRPATPAERDSPEPLLSPEQAELAITVRHHALHPDTRRCCQLRSSETDGRS
uniref:Col_cuticle_N domain-containing protein n=1 Tax=Globodera pallida TaxID=36090 RepID=A0A183CIG7_GLOPA